ncbi:hypothetical protein RIF29_40593 [Crotalaria pallida]|uniref:Uncharacterized protein n=1 Tax=Crotalaria pallida TaxID=3830 RepID=A0AAN9HQS2_CROPI
MGDKNTSLISTSNNPTTTKKTQSMYSKTFSSLGNLIKLLPTGTVFLFQFLNPVLTNNGHCHTLNKYLSGALLLLCGFSCAFSSFTDSYTGSDGDRHYAIVTAKGLWPSPASDGVDLSAYKLRVGDFVHAFVSVVVFAVLGLLDTNSVKCFYPEFESSEKLLMQLLPTVIGVVSSALFMIFPSVRHGIGYPTSADSNDTPKSDA